MKRLTYLDTWRAIAVGMVILGHLANNSRLVSWLAAHHVRGIFGYSRLGVLIFFFLSGLVVTKSCLAEGAEFTAAGFYARRIFRIVPPLLLYLCACAVLSAFGLVDFTSQNFVGAFFYVCNTSAPGVNCGWLAGHTWSLAFEEQFYAAFAFVFLLTLGRRPNRLSLFALIPMVFLPVLFPVDWIGPIGFVVTYCLFGLGALVARFEQPVNEWLGRFALPAFFIGAAICIFRPEYLHASAPSYQFAYLLGIPALVLSSGVLGGVVRAAFTVGWVAHVGRISYSVYLWQQLITGPQFATINPLIQVASLAGMVGGCALLFRHFETPCIQLGRRIAITRKAQGCAAT